MKIFYKIIISLIVSALLFVFSCSKEIEIEVPQQHSVFLVNKYNYDLPDEFSTTVKVIGFGDRYDFFVDVMFTKIGTDTFQLTSPLRTDELTTGLEISLGQNSLKAHVYDIQIPSLSADSIYIPISVGYPVIEEIPVSDITSTSASVKYKITDASFTPITETGVYLSTYSNQEYTIHNSTYNMVDSTYIINLDNLVPGTPYHYTIFVKYSITNFVLGGGHFDTLD